MPESPNLTILGLGIEQALQSGGNPGWETILTEAEYIAGGVKQLDALARVYPDLKAEHLIIDAKLEPLLHTLQTLHKQGRKIVLLSSGDPLYYGIASTLTGRADLKDTFSPQTIRILPGVSSIQIACARLGLPWADFISISLHGRTNWLKLGQAAMQKVPLAVLCDHNSSPEQISRYLLERGCSEYAMHIFENLGDALQERHYQLKLQEALDFKSESKVIPLRLVLLLPERAEPADHPSMAPEHKGPYLGIPDEFFEQKQGVITKGTARSAIIAALQLNPHDCLWDLGAGCGSVGIEACALLPKGVVYAVELRAERISLLNANRKKFGAANLEIIQADILDFVRQMPEQRTTGNPQRIFIGGGLSGEYAQCEEIISACWQDLARNGRLVASCVLLKTLENCRKVLTSLGGKPAITCIQTSHCSGLGQDVYFKANNPVFILAAEKFLC